MSLFLISTHLDQHHFSQCDLDLSEEKKTLALFRQIVIKICLLRQIMTALKFLLTALCQLSSDEMRTVAFFSSFLINDTTHIEYLIVCRLFWWFIFFFEWIGCFVFRRNINALFTIHIDTIFPIVQSYTSVVRCRYKLATS